MSIPHLTPRRALTLFPCHSLAAAGPELTSRRLPSHSISRANRKETQVSRHSRGTTAIGLERWCI